ncbi:MAG TPA: type I methionyl aminopeptidase [Spirochaetota bacterium]|nr:type I methionyl aminopeptidase [Spirochaetota bacterium]HPS88129.1 type I methionyl aminopeptidase [Spirochaetota bacterium]
MNRVVRLKTDDDIKRIKESGLIIFRLFKKINTMNLDGLSTWELDTFIDDFILKNKARPAFKTVRGYSFASCISVNQVASHGVPTKKKRILSGDIVKIDTGTVMNGYFADACSTFKIGNVTLEADRLVDAAYLALQTGIGEVEPEKFTGDVGFAVENCVRNLGYSVVKNFTGHGVGFALHEAPVVPNYGEKGKGTIIRPGMVLTVEPIVNQGSDELIIQEDGWTSITSDGKLSAQFEHTIAVTKNGPVILTSE